MAFSQVGEYIEDPEKIDAMIPVLVQHLAHNNPKVRHAAAHAIGQLADDMPNDFQKRYNTTVIPGLINLMDD
jgi:HEAT repeat protein